MSARPARQQKRAKALPAEARREQLLDVAGQILLEEGIRALTMERLAERANVSKGLGYAYFDDVEDVAVALWDREVADVYRRVEEAMTGDVRFEARARRAVQVYFDIVEARGALLGTLQSYLSRYRMERESGRRVVEFVQFWARQIVEEFGLKPVQANALAAQLLSSAEVMGRIWSLGHLKREEAEPLCMAFVLGGLRNAIRGLRSAERRKRAPKPRRKS